VRNGRESKIGVPCRDRTCWCVRHHCRIGEITLKGTGQYFDRLLILRRRFGTIKQTQVKRRFVSKNLDYRQVSTLPAHSA
jgi:hypothetical protein